MKLRAGRRAVSVWETIEDAVVQTLAGLTCGGSALLSTVRGHTSRDRKLVIGAISRERFPAAYVMTAGRGAGEKTFRRPGPPALSVLLAARSLRSDEEARTGAAEVTGVFTLSERVASALQDLAVGQDRRLLLVEERPAGGEEGTIIWDQSYEVHRRSGQSGPTFGGVALAGSASEVHVELGPMRRATASFSFPGVDGVFERNLGLRGRPITWRGQLRAADDAGLNTIESAIEQEVCGGQEKTMVDPWQRSHELCVLKSFHRLGRRGRDALSGEALQDFELEFTQLGR